MPSTRERLSGRTNIGRRRNRRVRLGPVCFCFAWIPTCGNPFTLSVEPSVACGNPLRLAFESEASLTPVQTNDRSLSLPARRSGRMSTDSRLLPSWAPRRSVP